MKWLPSLLTVFLLHACSLIAVGAEPRSQFADPPLSVKTRPLWF